MNYSMFYLEFSFSDDHKNVGICRKSSQGIMYINNVEELCSLNIPTHMFSIL